jgi:hypothetical protein
MKDPLELSAAIDQMENIGKAAKGFQFSRFAPFSQPGQQVRELGDFGDHVNWNEVNRITGRLVRVKKSILWRAKEVLIVRISHIPGWKKPRRDRRIARRHKGIKYEETQLLSLGKKCSTKAKNHSAGHATKKTAKPLPKAQSTDARTAEDQSQTRHHGTLPTSGLRI